MSHSSTLADRPTGATNERGIIIDVVTVTPAMAREWLLAKDVNRNLRPNRVEHYKRIIAAGQWVVTNDAVTFEGYLVNGTARLTNAQHRLTAIAECEIPVPMLVMQGAAPGSQVYMDTGSHRNFGDILKMQRAATDAAARAAAVSLGYAYDNSLIDTAAGTYGKQKPSNGDLLAWYDKNEDAVSEGVRWGRRLRREIGGNVTAGAVSRMKFVELDVDDADLFFDDLCGGVGIDESDPVFQLRRWYGRQAGNKRTTTTATFQLAMIIKAWNNRRAGDMTGKLAYYRPFGKGRENFPRPA